MSDAGLLALLLQRGCPEEHVDAAAQMLYARKLPQLYSEMIWVIDDVLALVGR